MAKRTNTRTTSIKRASSNRIGGKPSARKAAPAKKTSSRRIRLESMAAGLTAADAEKTVAWYCDVLGFAVAQRWQHEGKFLGATLTSGGVTFNINQDDWKLGRKRVKGQGVRLFITTAAGIDDYAAQVKARGGALAHEPVDEWGFRAFAIEDPDGYKLTFMTPLKKARK